MCIQYSGVLLYQFDLLLILFNNNNNLLSGFGGFRKKKFWSSAQDQIGYLMFLHTYLGREGRWGWGVGRVPLQLWPLLPPPLDLAVDHCPFNAVCVYC